MKAQLLIATGELAGKVLYLAEGQALKVGRTFHNDLSLNDPGVSREHAVFSYDGIVLSLKDLQSRNGTQVNRQKVAECLLNSGDEVQIGSTVIQVTTDVAEEEVAAAPPSELPLEGIRPEDEPVSTASDAALVTVTPGLAGPEAFTEATAERLPPELAAAAAEQEFLETHPTCVQCGRMIARREVGGGQVTRTDKGFICADCRVPGLGRVIGQYRLMELLNEGTTGRIFKAEHVTIKRQVAVKILLERLTFKESAKLRFLREARAGAALNHPNIVNMFDAGEQDGAFYLVMELVEGPNLQKLIQNEGALAPGRALQIAIQVARALEYAHGKGIVHRDIRPVNILIAPGDKAKLIDIGTAKWIEATGAGSLTKPGVAFGDFNYLAPELLRSEAQADANGDLFSLGVTLYMMLTGTTPYTANSIGEALERLKSGSVPPPSFSNPKLPEVLDGLVLRLMNLDPRKRAASAGALVEEMTELYARTFDDSFIRQSYQEEAEEEEDTGAPSEMKSDLLLARDIQSKLVPARIPDLPGYDLGKVYRPAKDVGGDYLDFFPVDKHQYAVIIADVSGKGVSGAMVMVMVRSVFKMVALLGKSPAETVVQANKILSKDIKKGMFVTLVYGILDTAKHMLRYANAGHNHPIFFRARSREVQMLRSPGMVLGISTSQVFEKTVEEFAVRLEPGDQIVLYTDGVTEAKDDEGQDFGNAMTLDMIRASAEGGSTHVVRTLMEGIAAHRGQAQQSDDITIFAIGRQA